MLRENLALRLEKVPIAKPQVLSPIPQSPLYINCIPLQLILLSPRGSYIPREYVPQRRSPLHARRERHLCIRQSACGKSPHHTITTGAFPIQFHPTTSAPDLDASLRLPYSSIELVGMF